MTEFGTARLNHVDALEDSRRVSLRARVGILAALVAALVVLLVSTAALVIVRASVLAGLDADLLQRATAAVQGGIDSAELVAVPGSLFGAADIRVAVVFASGTAVVSAAGPMSVPPLGPIELAVARDQVTQSVRTGTVAGITCRVVAVPLVPGQALVIARPLVPTYSVLTKLAIVLTAVGVVGALLAVFAGVAVARVGLRPFGRLTRAAENVALTGNLCPIPVDGNNEIARLTRSFNNMLQALASSQERQRRLIVDVGHELRSPLTSMRTNLELLILSDRSDTPVMPEGERFDILIVVQQQAVELSFLVGNLVTLAREEESSGQVQNPQF